MGLTGKQAFLQPWWELWCVRPCKLTEKLLLVFVTVGAVNRTRFKRFRSSENLFFWIFSWFQQFPQLFFIMQKRLGKATQP